MMLIKNLQKIFFALLFISSYATHATGKEDSTSSPLSTFLPKLKAYATPFSQRDFNYYLSPILEALQRECSLRQRPPEIQKDLEEACLLLPSWARLQELSQTLALPSISPLQFPLGSTTPHLELLQAGVWKKHLASKPPLGQPPSAFAFAADVLLTKAVMQKSLQAYSRLADRWSRNPNNTARVYLVPKLIQSLEGRTFLGSLFARYQQQKCGEGPILKNPRAKLCYIEKLRTAFLLHKLYEASKKDITIALRSLQLVSEEGNQARVRQIGELLPLNETLKTIHQNSISARELWEGRSLSGDKTWLVRLEGDFKRLTRYQIQLSDEDQVLAYVYASAILSLSDLQELSQSIDELASLSKESMPELEQSPEWKEMVYASQAEIALLSSGITYFIESQESSLEFQE